MLNITASGKDLREFFRHLVYLEQAGFSLTHSLNILKGFAFPRPLQKIIIQLEIDLRRGVLFSQALAQHRIFSDLVIQLVTVGEKSGSLLPAFQEISKHLHWDSELRYLLKKSLLYGVVMLVLVGGLIIGATFLILPEVQHFLANLGSDQLPLPTRSLIFLGAFIRSWGLLCLIVLGGILIWLYYARPAFLRRVPLWGPLAVQHNLIIYLKTLATLSTSKIDLFRALTQPYKLPFIGHQLEVIPQKVANGVAFSQALAESALFPPLVVRLVGLGETTGQMPALLDQSAQWLQDNYRRQLERLLALLHPITVIVLGFLLLWLILAVIFPLYEKLGLE